MMTAVPELLSAVAQLAWPVVVLVGVLLFMRPLTGLLRSGSEREDVTIEVGGQRITLGKFREQQNEATLDLRRQVDNLRRRLAGAPAAPPDPPSRRVLWVDDEPQNNALFIDQLRSDDVTVDLATTTAEGLRRASAGSYGAVITDMGRLEGDRMHRDAGLDFLRQLRADGDETPVAIFTSGRNVRSRSEEIHAAGAQVVTSSGVDLLAFLRSSGVIG